MVKIKPKMREQYLEMRRNNHLDLRWLYAYYESKFNKEKHNPFLNPQEFSQFFMMYINSEIGAVLRHLDEVFDVQKIEDEQGRIIYIN